MSPTLYNPLPRIGFLIARLAQCISTALFAGSLNITAYEGIYATNNNGDPVTYPNLPDLPHTFNVEPWQKAGFGFSVMAFVYVVIDTGIELVYGGLHFILLYSEYDRPRLFLVISSVVDILFAIIFAICAGYATRPVHGFTFFSDSCKIDAASISHTFNTTEPANKVAESVCTSSRDISQTAIVLSVFFVLTPLFLPFMRHQQKIFLSKADSGLSNRYHTIHPWIPCCSYPMSLQVYSRTHQLYFISSPEKPPPYRAYRTPVKDWFLKLLYCMDPERPRGHRQQHVQDNAA